ncbi:hypothetical protein LR48_Vigan02g070900 [Vigna angularis]|uniref:Uncharacterized protein n=1 Tax=Phaseolus angularis TaxID=3914 RepID=A0A0L9TWK8_PHAAN|nr:hypothetical protein LR48_Vigan02g070900 [Vigna angularis]
MANLDRVDLHRDHPRPTPIPDDHCSSLDSDLQLHRRPSRRNPQTLARLKWLAKTLVGKRSRPETPLSKWKIHDGDDPLEELDREKELPPLPTFYQTNNVIPKPFSSILPNQTEQVTLEVWAVVAALRLFITSLTPLS